MLQNVVIHFFPKSEKGPHNLDLFAVLNGEPISHNPYPVFMASCLMSLCVLKPLLERQSFKLFLPFF